MSFDPVVSKPTDVKARLNPFRAGRCLSTASLASNEIHEFRSQSLSSRAMSFDLLKEQKSLTLNMCLNPFRAGRCLSTESLDIDLPEKLGLNPFRAGRCLSTPIDQNINCIKKSQSLSSRAMSFDEVIRNEEREFRSLNPFRAGRCLSTLAQSSLQAIWKKSQSLSSRAMSFDHKTTQTQIPL